MNGSWSQWIFRLLRFGFGGILVYAALNKIPHPYEFASIIENYRVFGEGLSRWIAVWIPYLELIVGLLLIIGIWLDAASLINAGLMFIFLVLVTQAYIRHLDIDCGCFSVEKSEPIESIKILENIGYLCGSLLLLNWIHRGKVLLKI